VRRIGLVHGWTGSRERVVHELDVLRQRAEMAIAECAHWWMAVDGDLDADERSITSQLEGCELAQERLDAAIDVARAAHAAAPSTHTEISVPRPRPAPTRARRHDEHPRRCLRDPAERPHSGSSYGWVARAARAIGTAPSSVLVDVIDARSLDAGEPCPFRRCLVIGVVMAHDEGPTRSTRIPSR
jgi:hypothetical protein